MRQKIFKYGDKLFNNATALAKHLGIPPTSLRSHLTNHNITSGTFEYRSYSITILN